ncbi:MAG TPA: hypothetical protein VKE69_03860, partial [Planctomycetota bacterium]|nr:hypothetical protein [Planctomycetota bacterium]
FALVTFSVTGAMISFFSPDPRAASRVHLHMPSGRDVTLDDDSRSRAAAAYELFYATDSAASLFRVRGLQQHVFPFLLTGLGGIGTRTKGKKDQDHVLQFQLLAELGRDRGLDAGMADVKDWLQKAFPSGDDYLQLCDYFHWTPTQFESALAEALLVKRVLEVAQAQTPVPTGEEIVKEWASRNESSAFQVASFLAEDRKASIDASAVTDADLSKYLDGLPPMEKRKFEEPAKIAVEGIAVLDPAKPAGETFEKLVAAEALTETDARLYHSLARRERFRRPKTESAPAVTPESAPASAPATQPADEFLSFDEARERVEREAKVARALETVLAEAREAATQPNFELKTLADKYGLVYWSSGDPRANEDLEKLATHGSKALVAGLAAAKEGDFLPAYQTTPSAIEITRVTKKVPAKVPEVAAIREKLLPDYLDAKVLEKTRDDARALVTALEQAAGTPSAEGSASAPAVTAEKFEQLAREKGAKVESLAPIRKTRKFDPEFSKAPKDAARFLANRGGFAQPGQPKDPFDLAVGAFAGPYDDAEAKTLYVVRVAEKTTPTQADMGSTDWATARDSIREDLRRKKTLEMLSAESLSKQLQLRTGAES